MPFGRISEVYLLRDAPPNPLWVKSAIGASTAGFSVGCRRSQASKIDGAKIMVPMISFAFSPSPNKGHAPRPAAALLAGDRRLQARRAALAPQPACQGGTRYCAVWLQIFFEDALRLAHGLCAVRVQAFGSFMR
jgi:hypothetical protein